MINIFFKTYGCQANVADSQNLMTYLKDLGCAPSKDEKEADLIFVNSCAVREKAEQKMFSYLGELRQYKKDKPYVRIGVIGCVASYRKKEIYERYDHVNFVFGAREDMSTFQQYLMDMIVGLETTKQLYWQSPEGFIHKAGQDRDIKKLVEEKSSFGSSKVQASTPGHTPTSSPLLADNEVKRSFINIMTGCNNYCTYCIVPFTRGVEKSYGIKYIVDRVAREVSDGAKEVTLIGQNVNSYKDPETGETFAALLHQVAQVPGQFWVRYVSPHPKDMTLDVLETMAKFPEKLCSWVHLPLQAGSDRILEAMGRTYNMKRYMEIVDWIHKVLPQATITTDIIVGFPGEEEEDFRSTMNALELVRYDLIYSFIYSRRKYTKAYNLGDPVPLETKHRWLEELQGRHKEICLERNLRWVGRKVRALVEKKASDGRLLARSSGNHRLILEGEDSLIGKFVDLIIKHAGPANLECSLI